MKLNTKLLAGIVTAAIFIAAPWTFAAEAEKSGSKKKVDNEVKQLSGISIIGNKEAPKSLYIVPWKSSEVGVESGLNSSLLDPTLQPLDKEVFMRELEFYQLSQSDD